MLTMIGVILTSFLVLGCSTLGGAMQGAGEDLGRAGEYVRGIGR
jgi:predicted small secreted protein